MVKKATNYRFLGILMVVIISVLIFTQIDYGQEANKSTKVEETIETGTNTSTLQQGYTKVTLPMESVENIDAQIEEYLFDLWPIMSDEEIEAIKGSKDIGKKLVNDTLGLVEFSLNINVPSHYLDPAPTMLWELNIPEFTPRKIHFNITKRSCNIA